MEQHPIPQQISSYEFKLVGDMTLKQFLKAAAGIVLAIIINSTKLVVVVKWPLMLLFGGSGLLLAFVPFEDRPLETWIVSFLKRIYSPTIFIYKRGAVKNWLDLDLSKKQNEEDLVMGTVEIKEKEVEEKITMETKQEIETKTEVKEEDWKDNKTNLNLKTERLEATGQANFGTIPMPDIPVISNVIVGMATNMEGKIIDGVIIEIQDEQGKPSRVLKTNSLGQFKTTTPLANGRYLIIAEKNGYNFDRVNIDLNNEIVQPIRIISNN